MKQEEDLAKVDSEMKDCENNNNDNDGDDGEGWDEQNDDDEGGWDDYGEEDEMDEVVKQALEQTRKKKELEEQIEQITITFKPPGYHAGMVAQIVGDFTDWVPFTMHMHSVQDMKNEPSKYGEFFVVVKLAKGFRYRYLFEIDLTEIVD